MAERDKVLSPSQEMRAAANYALPPVHMNALHLITHKGKRDALFDIAVFEQHGNHGFCQRFIAELIQLVPTVSVTPFSSSLG